MSGHPLGLLLALGGALPLEGYLREGGALSVASPALLDAYAPLPGVRVEHHRPLDEAWRKACLAGVSAAAERLLESRRVLVDLASAEGAAGGDNLTQRARALLCLLEGRLDAFVTRNTAACAEYVDAYTSLLNAALTVDSATRSSVLPSLVNLDLAYWFSESRVRRARLLPLHPLRFAGALARLELDVDIDDLPSRLAAWHGAEHVLYPEGRPGFFDHNARISVASLAIAEAIREGLRTLWLDGSALTEHRVVSVTLLDVTDGVAAINALVDAATERFHALGDAVRSARLEVRFARSSHVDEATLHVPALAEISEGARAALDRGLQQGITLVVERDLLPIKDAAPADLLVAALRCSLGRRMPQSPQDGLHVAYEPGEGGDLASLSVQGSPAQSAYMHLVEALGLEARQRAWQRPTVSIEPDRARIIAAVSRVWPERAPPGWGLLGHSHTAGHVILLLGLEEEVQAARAALPTPGDISVSLEDASVRFYSSRAATQRGASASDVTRAINLTGAYEAERLAIPALVLSLDSPEGARWLASGAPVEVGADRAALLILEVSDGTAASFARLRAVLTRPLISIDQIGEEDCALALRLAAKVTAALSPSADRGTRATLLHLAWVEASRQRRAREFEPALRALETRLHASAPSEVRAECWLLPQHACTSWQATQLTLPRDVSSGPSAAEVSTPVRVVAPSGVTLPGRLDPVCHIPPSPVEPADDPEPRMSERTQTRPRALTVPSPSPAARESKTRTRSRTRTEAPTAADGMSGATPPSAVLQRIKQSTSEEFRALRSRRGTPVYVIEHGLAAEDISELKSALVEALKREPLVSAGQLAAAWRDAFLPLAIVAVEVGYQYGSDGNEYWPRLAETLSTSFDGDAERRALVDGFRRLTALTGVEPPANAWSHQFSLIAWPITHAVLPVWLHEPLLEAIIACPHRVRLGSAASVASGDDYLRWMKEYCARTPRLMSLFDQEPLARTVIERLLGRETGGRLSESFVRRIERDIDAQRRSRQLIRDARRVHVHVTARRAGPGSRAGKPPEHTIPQSATLLLTIDDHQPSLDIAPLLRTTGEIDIALDRVRVRPLGEGRLVSLGSLLRAGARLEVPLLCTDDHHKPLFQEADLKMLDRSLAMRLRQISIDVRDPLLFSEPPGGRGRAHQVLQRRFAERDGWWVLTAQTTDDLPEGVEDKGLVCGLHCLRIDASRGQASDWLRGHGFEPFRQPMVQVVSSPSFDAWHEIAGTLHARDTLAFLVKNGPVEASGLGLLADGLHIVEFESATGPAAIELAQPGARGASIGVTVVESPPVRAALVRVDLEGPSFSVRALIQRSLALRVIGREPIAGLRLTLRLRRGEKVVSRAFSRPLPALPALVAPESTVWDDLTADVTLTERDTLVLEVDVAGLTTATWRLEPTHAIAPRDDASDSRTFIALRPHIAVERGPTSSLEVSSSALNQPFGVDRPLLGQGLCTRATRSAIHLTVSRPERLLRQADDDGPGIGLMTLQSAYLAWTTAQSADKIAEAHRHEAATHLDLWMAECLCGDRWAAVERRRAPRAASYGAFVAQQLYESGVARDPLLEAELGEALSAVQSALLRELAAALEGAEAWLRRIGDRSCGINDACEALANVVNQAYQAALSTTRPNSDTTADVACEPDHCARVLREASAEWEARATLRTFVSLALPQSIRRALQDLEFDGPDDAWLASDLARLLRDTQAKWSDAEVTSLLALWVRPRALIGHVDLTRAISDRVGARALRYAALRRRNAVGVRL